MNAQSKPTTDAQSVNEEKPKIGQGLAWAIATLRSKRFSPREMAKLELRIATIQALWRASGLPDDYDGTTALTVKDDKDTDTGTVWAIAKLRETGRHLYETGELLLLDIVNQELSIAESLAIQSISGQLNLPEWHHLEVLANRD